MHATISNSVNSYSRFNRFNNCNRARPYKDMNTWCDLSLLENKTMKLCEYKSNKYGIL